MNTKDTRSFARKKKVAIITKVVQCEFLLSVLPVTASSRNPVQLRSVLKSHGNMIRSLGTAGFATLSRSERWVPRLQFSEFQAIGRYRICPRNQLKPRLMQNQRHMFWTWKYEWVTRSTPHVTMDVVCEWKMAKIKFPLFTAHVVEFQNSTMGVAGVWISTSKTSDGTHFSSANLVVHESFSRS